MALTFDNWVKFTATHAGRDKLFRFAQYASKLASAQLKSAAGTPVAVATATKAVAVAKTAGGAVTKTAVVLSPALELAGQLGRLSSALSNARKLFRFGKFVEGLQKAYVLVSSMSSAKVTLAQFVSIAKNLTTGLYLFYDSLQWINDSGVRKSPHAQQIKDRRNAFYAASIFFSFCEAFLKLRKNLRQLSKEEQASTNLDAAIASKARGEVAKLQKENNDLLLELAKNFVDFPLPLVSLKYLNWSDATVGAAGTFTSAIALKLTWAKETASKSK